MIQTIRKAWGIPELRKKIIFTLLILLIFRIGNAITVPYVNVTLLEDYLNQMGGTILGLYNVMSGGAFAQATVFALSIRRSSPSPAIPRWASPSCRLSATIS